MAVPSCVPGGFGRAVTGPVAVVAVVAIIPGMGGAATVTLGSVN
jgi:hypothetical protein